MQCKLLNYLQARGNEMSAPCLPTNGLWKLELFVLSGGFKPVGLGSRPLIKKASCKWLNARGDESGEGAPLLSQL